MRFKAFCPGCSYLMLLSEPVHSLLRFHHQPTPLSHSHTTCFLLSFCSPQQQPSIPPPLWSQIISSYNQVLPSTFRPPFHTLAAPPPSLLWYINKGNGFCVAGILTRKERGSKKRQVTTSRKKNGKANKSTIVLMNASQNRATRAFMDYDSISQAIVEIAMEVENGKLAFYAFEFIVKWIAWGENTSLPFLLSVDEGLIVSALATAGICSCINGEPIKVLKHCTSVEAAHGNYISEA
ncbi:hypothetical protein PTKIN_Ptkin08bG0205500 [Pterospermum kingtungense]